MCIRDRSRIKSLGSPVRARATDRRRLRPPDRACTAVCACGLKSNMPLRNSTSLSPLPLSPANSRRCSSTVKSSSRMSSYKDRPKVNGIGLVRGAISHAYVEQDHGQSRTSQDCLLDFQGFSCAPEGNSPNPHESEPDPTRLARNAQRR